MKYFPVLLCVLTTLFFGCAVSDKKIAMEETLKTQLQKLQTQQPDAPGFAIAVIYHNELSSAATGVASPDGRAMTANTPLRIASITKTFVAAAVLKLWEQGLVDLDASIKHYISSEHNRLLMADGYQTDVITVRHLLMHAAGMDDHFASDDFKQRVLADTEKVWTRTEQLQTLVETTEPRSAPGQAFYYSDSGYLLLGELIETITGQALGAAVKQLNRFDQIGLQNAVWEGEKEPDTPARAHQYLGGMDTFHIHGSLDAFGGGGLIMSVIDVAKYVKALFNGEVFDSEQTLKLMTSAPGHPELSPYRMGLFTETIDGKTVYGHGGFWGTDVKIVPEANLIVSGVVLDQQALQRYRRAANDIIGSVFTGE